MEDVVTGIDGLIKYIGEKGETDIAALASALKVSENTVQEWSLVLERAKLLRIVYKMGKMYVSPTTVAVELGEPGGEGKETDVHYEKMTASEMGNLVSVKSAIMKDQLSIQEREVDSLTPTIQKLKEYIQDVQKGFRDKSAELNKYLGELSTIKDQASKDFDNVSSYRQQVDKLIEDLNRGYGAADIKSLKTDDVDAAAKSVELMINEMRRQMEGLRNSSNGLLQEFESKAGEQRKGMLQLSENIKKDGKKLDDFIKSAQDFLAEYKKQANAYRRDFEANLARSAKERAAALDKAMKAKKAIDGLYGVAGKKSAALVARVNEEQAGLGKLAELDRDLKNLKSSIDAISAERDAIKKEISELNVTIGSMPKGKIKDMTQSSKVISDAEKKISSITKRVKGLKGAGKETGQRIEDITGKKN